MLNNIFARVATVVVWRTCQLVLYLRVYQAEFIALRLEWEVFKFAAVAIEAHQLTFLAENRSKLVHDTTVYTYILVLSSLACENEIPFRNLVVTKEVVQSKSKTAFKSSR